jgi:hypothetical protein
MVKSGFFGSVVLGFYGIFEERKTVMLFRTRKLSIYYFVDKMLGNINKNTYINEIYYFLYYYCQK